MLIRNTNTLSSAGHEKFNIFSRSIYLSDIFSSIQKSFYSIFCFIMFFEISTVVVFCLVNKKICCLHSERIVFFLGKWIIFWRLIRVKQSSQKGYTRMGFRWSIDMSAAAQITSTLFYAFYSCPLLAQCYCAVEFAQALQSPTFGWALCSQPAGVYRGGG